MTDDKPKWPAPTDAEVTDFISELLATAEDEANDITDLPVDDILNKAADMLDRMREQMRVYKNGYDMAAGIQAQLESEVEYLKDCNDKVAMDQDVLLTALAEQGYTEWVDSDGVVRPIPLPWPLHPDTKVEENTMTMKHKMLMAKSHPPRMMTPRPDDIMMAQEPYQRVTADQMRALLAWRTTTATNTPLEFRYISES